MTPLLSGKNCIIHGAGSGIGAGAARTFAGEGARLFLAGRARDRLDYLADQIAADGRTADVPVVDALDEAAIHDHARAVVAAARDHRLGGQRECGLVTA
jgi:3-oxoacyl-[acyl-carrier protein] reductase